jgi:hypothetical protein
MFPNAKGSELLSVLATIDPASQAAGAASTGWVSVANYFGFLALVQTGVLGTSATVDAKLQQALDSSGTGAKDISGKAITQIVKATGDNKQVLVNVKPEELDTVNGFGFVRVTVTVGVAASITSAQLLGLILLVVWDGVSIDDEVVPLLLSAALAMKPVIWIDVTGVVRVLQRELLTKAQRHILQCPSPPIQSLVSCFSLPIALQNPLMFLQAISDPATFLDSSAHQRDAIGKSRAGTVHKFMMALVQGRFKKALTAVAASPISAYRGPAWDESEGIIASTPVLDAQFDRADVAASISAGKHRSAAWISSLASTTAVFAAVAGAINLWSSLHGAFWALLELGLVALVVSVLWRAKNMQWHRKWIGNRFVAEQLRYTRMGLPLLAVTKSLSEPSLHVLNVKRSKHVHRRERLKLILQGPTYWLKTLNA